MSADRFNIIFYPFLFLRVLMCVFLCRLVHTILFMLTKNDNRERE
jgi:hypothetical protein